MKKYVRVRLALGALLFAFVTPVAGADVTLSSTATRDEIQAALDGVTDGSTVTLPAGTYSIGSTLYVTNNVKLVGAGMGATILSATGNFDKMFSMNHASAVVSGVCVSNVVSKTWWSGDAMAVKISAGRFENSRVTCCMMKEGQNRQGCVSVHSANAVVSHCRLDHNSLCQSGNRGGGVVVTGGGLVENCLIDHNKATYGGGVCFQGAGKVVNCTIVDNTDNTSLGGGIYCDSASARMAKASSTSAAPIAATVTRSSSS